MSFTSFCKKVFPKIITTTMEYCMDSKLEVCKCKLSEVACLAQQSARVPAVRSNLLPRRLRQRSRLIDK